MTKDSRLRLAFSGLHPDRTRVLLAEHGPERARRLLAEARIRVSAGAQEAACVKASERRSQLNELGIQVAFRGSDSYPEHLATLPDAPDLLFYRGRLPPRPGVAIVGTRTATRYGLDLAESMGAAAASAGWPVVSGLARGIDQAAHYGTIRAGGVGIGVLGCGLEVPYPARSGPLKKRIVEGGGAVVSEYPPHSEPAAWRFPPRNRIISGMAGAVVVVEARPDGGALITARTALEQGRDVLVVPGNVDRPTSKGCNYLIRDGAHPVLGPEDLVECLSFSLGPPLAEKPALAEDGLLASIGPVGRYPDELAAELELPITDLLVELAKLEAAGTVALDRGLVRLVR